MEGMSIELCVCLYVFLHEASCKQDGQDIISQLPNLRLAVLIILWVRKLKQRIDVMHHVVCLHTKP